MKEECGGLARARHGLPEIGKGEGKASALTRSVGYQSSANLRLT